jgi:hypothetical protein
MKINKNKNYFLKFYIKGFHHDFINIIIIILFKNYLIVSTKVILRYNSTKSLG